MKQRELLGARDENDIEATYTKTEIGLIPAYWRLEKLKNVTSVIIDGTHFTPTYLSYGIPFLRVTDIHGTVFTSEFKYISSKEHQSLIKRCKPEKGDLLLSKNGTIGIPKVVDWDWDFSIFVSLALIRPKKLFLNVNFLYQFFKSSFLDLQLSQRAKQGTVVNLHLEEIRELLIPLPKIEEQQKIATALSNTDALISELEKLIEKKQAIKNATMQQLLTGKTRLPEFALREDGTPKSYKYSELGQIPEDWGVYPLKSLLKSQPKYGINAAATQLSGDLPTYIRITDIDENGKFNPSEKVGVDSPLSGNYILEQGDIVLARTGASVGKSYLYDKDDGELVYAGFLIKISPAPNLLCSKYLSIYLQTKEYWDWIATNSMRSGQPGINGNQYASLKIVLPSFNEQLKISRIFKDIDRDLEQLKIKLDKVTLLKQGMMQELLTGKTRLV